MWIGRHRARARATGSRCHCRGPCSEGHCRLLPSPLSLPTRARRPRQRPKLQTPTTVTTTAAATSPVLPTVAWRARRTASLLLHSRPRQTRPLTPAWCCSRQLPVAAGHWCQRAAASPEGLAALILLRLEREWLVLERDELQRSSGRMQFCTKIQAALTRLTAAPAAPTWGSTGVSGLPESLLNVATGRTLIGLTGLQ